MKLKVIHNRNEGKCSAKDMRETNSLRKRNPKIHKMKALANQFCIGARKTWLKYLDKFRCQLMRQELW